ncbi:hypothetical protein [Streptomyces sp. HPF1205]|uniref:hypothetical protein n=1 Tax=Streptomyces sp. HPF1205 TaxID=2873262 RepID=UPI001CEC9D4F|nr:hypothetical protein [Streptomyces sp. HPF1205]
MAKHRVTLTPEVEEEAAVRAAAEEAGLDLSAFLRVAALAEVARIRRVRENFGEIDRLSREAEEAPAQPVGEESRNDDAAMDAYLDAIDAGLGSRGGGAAA